MKNPGRKAVVSWALYDWANSAFATTVMAGFFPLFFKQFWNHGVDPALSTARLGLGNSVSGLAIVILAPRDPGSWIDAQKRRGLRRASQSHLWW